jgi:hypothetical protein
MIIKQETPTQNNEFDNTSSTHDPFASSIDINFFNSLIAPSSFPNKKPSYTETRSALFEFSNKLDTLTKNMTKGLRALSDRERSDEARKYPSQLSDSVLLTHVGVKSIGKSAQCVDKICNLQ